MYMVKVWVWNPQHILESAMLTYHTKEKAEELARILKRSMEIYDAVVIELNR